MWVSDVAWLASKVRYDEGAGWEQWPNLCASVEELCVAGIEVDTHGAVQDGVLVPAQGQLACRQVGQEDGLLLGNAVVLRRT